MLIAKFVALAIALAIFVAVGVRNIGRDFRPTVRSHVELFFAGAPLGFIGMLILIQDGQEAIIFGILTGVLTGSGLSYSTPRQWRYWNEPRLRKNQ